MVLYCAELLQKHTCTCILELKFILRQSIATFVCQ